MVIALPFSMSAPLLEVMLLLTAIVPVPAVAFSVKLLLLVQLIAVPIVMLPTSAPAPLVETVMLALFNAVVKSVTLITELDALGV
jgi:hypothetical protein